MPSPLGSSVSVRIPILSDDGRYPLPCYIFEMCVSGLSSRHTCKCVGRLPDAEQDFIIFPFQQQAMGVVLLRVFAHLFPNQSPPRNLRRHVFEGDLRSATARAGGIFQQKNIRTPENTCCGRFRFSTLSHTSHLHTPALFYYRSRRCVRR